MRPVLDPGEVRLFNIKGVRLKEPLDSEAAASGDCPLIGKHSEVCRVDEQCFQEIHLFEANARPIG